MTMHIVLMGAPGSGKGTFSEFLSKNDDYFHFSLGDVLRKEIAEKTALGLECKPYVEEGKMIPFETGVKVHEKYYEKGISQGRFMIVDGMVLSEEYANYFKQFYTDKKVGYVFLNASRAVCEERIVTRKICKRCAKIYSFNASDCCQEPLEKRTDDSNKEAVARRLDRFFNNAIRFVDFFKDSNLIEIDTDHSLTLLQEEYQNHFIAKVSTIGCAGIEHAVS